MARPSPLIEHLLRRAGFGVSDEEREPFLGDVSYRQAVDRLLAYEGSTDVDQFVGAPGYLGTSSGFAPNTNIQHARQRWLFRMVHSPAPLIERMTLVWHHHFATGYNKIVGVYGAADATRLMAADPDTDPVHQMGQNELLRQRAFGSFRDMLIAVAQDPAMLVWLDGISNLKAKPQENFARELMELFTFGVGNFTESDVYAAARVFTGWNLSRVNTSFGAGSFSFIFNAGQHETSAKEFTFPIYTSRRGGGGGQSLRTIPSRNASAGMQDGIDLITALAYHPETARRLARRMWTWFVSETEPASGAFVDAIAKTYLDNQTSIRAVMRAVFSSKEFQDPKRFYQRYAWPVEFVVRALKEVGRRGFNANDALTPLVNMGQQLFEPPDVNGWELGPAWYSTGGMLARLNFASQLATNQRVALRDASRPFGATPESLVEYCYDRLTLPPPTPEETAALVAYANATGWSGSDAQLLVKTPGLFHMLAGSAEYQLV